VPCFGPERARRYQQPDAPVCGERAHRDQPHETLSGFEMAAAAASALGMRRVLLDVTAAIEGLPDMNRYDIGTRPA
jgi:hypothetical protein